MVAVVPCSCTTMYSACSSSTRHVVPKLILAVIEVLRVFSICSHLNVGDLFTSKLKFKENDLDNWDPLTRRTWQLGPIWIVDPSLKKRNTWTAQPKWPWPKNKKAAMLGLAHEANKNWQKKYTKLAELMGSAHINTQLDRADSNFWPFQLVAILPRQIATSDPTWPGQTASDQNKRSWVQRPSVLVVNVYDLLTEKVVNFSLRLPAFDLLFLVTKRSQMKNNDLSVTNSQGHKLTYFL